MNRQSLSVGIMMCMLPATAQAQHIPDIVVLIAAIPLFNAVMVVVHASIKRSVKQFVMHAMLMMVWIALFWLAASYTHSDVLAWLPVALSFVHALLLVYASIHYVTSAGSAD